MNTQSSEDFYCSNTIRLARNVVVYSKSPSPWSPFAPMALEQIAAYLNLKQVADMTPLELRRLVVCILEGYFDPQSAAALVQGIPDAVVDEVLGSIRRAPKA